MTRGMVTVGCDSAFQLDSCWSGTNPDQMGVAKNFASTVTSAAEIRAVSETSLTRHFADFIHSQSVLYNSIR